MSKLKLPDSIKQHNLMNKRFAVAVVLIIAAVLGSWAIFINGHKNEKVYAEVAGHKIYKQDIDDLIGKNKNITEHDAATVLADKYLTEQLAKESGIAISDNEIAKALSQQVKKQKNTNKYLYQYQINQLYFNELSAHNRGIYKGKLIIANFSRHVEFKPVLPEDRQKDPKLGSAAAIAQDKNYAKNFITRLHNEIDSGKITFDQAINMERNDPQVGLKAYPSLPHSGLFDTSSYANPILNIASVRQQINSIKAGETAKPFVVRVGNSLSGNSTAESYFLMVHMDQSSNSYSGMTFDQYLDQTKKHLGYKVNV